jgi:hypothetical protein
VHGLGSLRQAGGSLFTLTGRILFTGIDMGGWCHVYWHHTPHRAAHKSWGGHKMSVQIEAPGTWIRCTTAMDEPETYSDTARGQVITTRRAVAECAAHGITDPSDIDELCAEAQLSPGRYDAYRLLVALGY